MSETIISENFSKKPRGRPPLFPKEYKAAIKGLYGSYITTERSVYNKHYLAYAQNILQKDCYIARYGTFFLDKKTGHFKKQTVMTALGRVLEKYSEETMIELADVIYEQRMNTKQAVTFIRQCQGYTQDQGPSAMKAIIRVLNDHRLTLSESRTVLKAVLLIVNSQMEEPTPEAPQSPE